jgi:hypothetical protein
MWDTFSTPEAGIVEQVHSNIQKQLGKKLDSCAKNVIIILCLLHIIVHLFILHVFISECNRVYTNQLPCKQRQYIAYIISDILQSRDHFLVSFLLSSM